ncbi:MAG: amidohydrolase family protein, partial [Candidatus Binatia bacterium]
IPHVIEDENGSAWSVDGTLTYTSGLANAAGQKEEEFSPKSKTFDGMRPGAYDSTARLADMDLDGVDAQATFPTLPGPAGGRFAQLPDKEYAIALIRAYNDWLVEEWSAADPARILGLAVLPLWDLDAAGKEIHRAHERGLKGVTLPSAPHSFEGVPGFPDPAWDPVWRALEDTKMPALIHIVSGNADYSFLQPGAGAPAAVFVHLAPSSNMTVLSTLLFSDVLLRFPKLKFISAESGIGWVPYFLERADYTFRKHRFWTGVTTGTPPSELFRQSIHVNYISDQSGIEQRHRIGVDNIMLGIDYPHTDTTWPNTQKVIQAQMGGIPEDERAKICAGNAVRVFGL